MTHGNKPRLANGGGMWGERQNAALICLNGIATLDYALNLKAAKFYSRLARKR